MSTGLKKSTTIPQRRRDPALFLVKGSSLPASVSVAGGKKNPWKAMLEAVSGRLCLDDAKTDMETKLSILRVL